MLEVGGSKPSPPTNPLPGAPIRIWRNAQVTVGESNGRAWGTSIESAESRGLQSCLPGRRRRDGQIPAQGQRKVSARCAVPVASRGRRCRHGDDGAETGEGSSQASRAGRTAPAGEPAADQGGL